MSRLDQFAVRIRRRQTPFYDRLYRLAKSLRAIHIPVIPFLHQALYYERGARLALWNGGLRIFYYEPLFKTRCEIVGRNLTLIDGIPVIMGSLRIRIGDNVTISGVTTLVGSKMADDPILDIGSGSYIGYQTGIVSGRGVHIGEYVLIANRVFIAADDGHPIDFAARRANLSPASEDLKEIWIEDDVWIGEGATILKGVRLGKGAIVASHAVVTKDVPPYSVVAGNPASIVKQLS